MTDDDRRWQLRAGRYTFQPTDHRPRIEPEMTDDPRDPTLVAGDYRLLLAVLGRDCDHPRRFRIPLLTVGNREGEWECTVCHTAQVRQLPDPRIR